MRIRMEEPVPEVPGESREYEAVILENGLAKRGGIAG